MRMLVREEAIAEKIVTLTLRNEPMDVLDIWFLTKEEFNKDLLRKCVLIYSLCDKGFSIAAVNFNEYIQRTLLINDIKRRVNDRFWQELQIQDRPIRAEIGDFLNGLIQDLTEEEHLALSKFYLSEPLTEQGKDILLQTAEETIREVVDLIDPNGELSTDVRVHPALIDRWLKLNTTFYPKRKRRGRERWRRQ